MRPRKPLFTPEVDDMFSSFFGSSNYLGNPSSGRRGQQGFSFASLPTSKKVLVVFAPMVLVYWIIVGRLLLTIASPSHPADQLATSAEGGNLAQTGHDLDASTQGHGKAGVPGAHARRHRIWRMKGRRWPTRGQQSMFNGTSTLLLGRDDVTTRSRRRRTGGTTQPQLRESARAASKSRLEALAVLSPYDREVVSADSVVDFTPGSLPLREVLSTKSLQTMYLDFLRYTKSINMEAGESAGEETKKVGEQDGWDDDGFGARQASSPVACRGNECPVFSHCYAGYPNVASCYQAGLEDKRDAEARLPANCGGAGAVVLASVGNGEGVGNASSALPGHFCAHQSDRQPHPAWLGQVFILNNVFVNAQGQVFNRTHLFDHNACPASQEPPGIYPSGTPVRHVSQGFSLASARPLSPLGAATASLLPLLFSLQDTFSALPQATLLFPGEAGAEEPTGAEGQGAGVEKGAGEAGVGGSGGGGVGAKGSKSDMEAVLALLTKGVFGLDVSQLKVDWVARGELVFVDELVQPLHQRCARPSRSLWRLLRGHHLLPKQGLPLFNPDLSARDVPDKYQPLRNLPTQVPVQQVKTRTKGSSLSGPSAPPWYVLLGRRPGACSSAEMTKMHKELIALFGPERVRTLTATAALDFPKLKHLFNQVRFFVAAHGPLLAYMVLMPPGGHVLELRPSQYSNAVYHHLAEACDHTYYLSMGVGSRPSGMRLGDMNAVLSVMHSVADKMLQEERVTASR